MCTSCCFFFKLLKHESNLPNFWSLKGFNFIQCFMILTDSPTLFILWHFLNVKFCQPPTTFTFLFFRLQSVDVAIKINRVAMKLLVWYTTGTAAVHKSNKKASKLLYKIPQKKKELENLSMSDIPMETGSVFVSTSSQGWSLST